MQLLWHYNCQSAGISRGLDPRVCHHWYRIESDLRIKSGEVIEGVG